MWRGVNVDTWGSFRQDRCIHNVDTARFRMEMLVKKWSNSAAVRISASILEAVYLKLDQAVDVREERGRIVIEP